jgi:hypothetical protein
MCHGIHDGLAKRGDRIQDWHHIVVFILSLVIVGGYLVVR